MATKAKHMQLVGGMLGSGGRVLGRETSNADPDLPVCRRGVRVAPEKAIMFSRGRGCWTGSGCAGA